MFNYFYGDENENFLFLQIPLALLKDDRFRMLSMEARVLYSLMLNRSSLSAKNGWKDKQGRVYIIYTLDEVMEDLICCKDKANKSMKELRDAGLIKSVRTGQGKPNIIYVMNFDTPMKYSVKSNEVPETLINPQKSVKQTSGSPQNRFLEVCKTDAIYINYNKIDTETESQSQSESVNASEIELSTMELSTIGKPDSTMTYVTNATQQVFTGKEKELTQTHADQSNGLPSSPSNKQLCNQYTTYAELEATVKKNIFYDVFIQERHPYIKLINAIVHNMVDVLTTDDEYIEFKKGNRLKTSKVKEVYLRLGHEHVLYTLERFKDVKYSVINKSNYLKSILLSSLNEMEAYYQNERKL